MPQIEILTTDDSVKAIAEEWREFDDQYGTSAFADYDWYEPWMHHLGAPAGKTPHIVTLRENGKLVGLLPLVVMKKSGMRILQCMGKDAFFPCELIVSSPEYIQQLWDAAHQSPHYDFAVLGYVDDASPSAECLKHFGHARDVKKAPYIQVQSPTGAAWLDTLSKQTRRELRRHERRLEEQGSISYRMHVGGPQLMPLIDEMITQKKAWSETRNKTGLFDQDGVRDFFQHWVAQTSHNGQAILAVLYVNEKPIAFNLLFAYRKVMVSYFVTYDKEWGKFSAGNLIMSHANQWAIDNGFTEVDFMQGETRSKSDFANNARTQTEYTFSRGSIGAIKESLYIGLRNIKQKKAA